MKNDLTSEQLNQEITVTLPLIAVLRIAERDVPAATLQSVPLTTESCHRKIGAPGAHGIYAGIARADENGPDHIVEVLAQADKPLTWQEAMDWAASIGGTLPTRKEQALLFANVPELFEKEWYWSCEQFAGNESSAWCQGFGFGTQSYNPKGSKLRARAVRRLNLE